MVHISDANHWCGTLLAKHPALWGTEKESKSEEVSLREVMPRGPGGHGKPKRRGHGEGEGGGHNERAYSEF